MKVIEGGLSDAQAAASRIRDAVEKLNATLRAATALGVSVHITTASSQSVSVTMSLKL